MLRNPNWKRVIKMVPCTGLTARFRDLKNYPSAYSWSPVDSLVAAGLARPWPWWGKPHGYGEAALLPLEHPRGQRKKNGRPDSKAK
jgi:hypothetical protein